MQPARQGFFCCVRHQWIDTQPVPYLDLPPAARAERSMTLSEYEHLTERIARFEKWRRSAASLRRVMQLFEYKLALHNVQRMQLPSPLPEDWQLASTGSACSLPSPVRRPATVRRPRPATLPHNWQL